MLCWEMTILPKLIYILGAVFVKILMPHFTNLEKKSNNSYESTKDHEWSKQFQGVRTLLEVLKYPTSYYTTKMLDFVKYYLCTH